MRKGIKKVALYISLIFCNEIDHQVPLALLTAGVMKKLRGQLVASDG